MSLCLVLSLPCIRAFSPCTKRQLNVGTAQWTKCVSKYHLVMGDNYKVTAFLEADAQVDNIFLDANNCFRNALFFVDKSYFFIKQHTTFSNSHWRSVCVGDLHLCLSPKSPTCAPIGLCAACFTGQRAEHGAFVMLSINKRRHCVLCFNCALTRVVPQICALTCVVTQLCRTRVTFFLCAQHNYVDLLSSVVRFEAGSFVNVLIENACKLRRLATVEFHDDHFSFQRSQTEPTGLGSESGSVVSAPPGSSVSASRPNHPMNALLDEYKVRHGGK